MMSNDIQSIGADIDNNVHVGPSFLTDDPAECVRVIGNMTSNYNVIIQNIRSIGHNFEDFGVLLARLNVLFDFIVLTECWLPRINNLPSLNGYRRFATNQHINQSSGVVVYVSDRIDVQVYEPTIVDTNSLVVKVNNDFAMLATYRTPSESNIDNFLNSLNVVLSDLKNVKQVVFTGDINIDIKPNNKDSRYPDYMNLLSMHGFLPSHTFPTRKGNCIDHSFLNIGNKATTVVINSSVTDHSAVVIAINTNFANSKAPKLVTKVDYTKTLQLLRETDWQPITDCRDPDLATNMFLEILRKIIKTSSHNHTLTNRKRNIKPWITPGLLRCIKWRDKLHNQLKKDPNNPVLSLTYKRYRNFCNRLLNNMKVNYEKSEIEKNKNNIKKTWKILRQICNLDDAVKKPATELLNLKNDVQESVNYVNEYFTNVGKKLAHEILSKINKTENYLAQSFKSKSSPVNSILFTPTDEVEITTIIKSLKNSSSAGWDGISAIFLKKGSKYLCKPITHICNHCLETGIFPTSLKSSIIIPIFKSGSRDSVTNYRPIALLPSLSKIIEKIINTRLIGFLDKHNFFSSNQYGFRKKLSTSDAIQNLVSFVSQKLDTKNKCIAIFLDLAKAFDTVSVPILIQKLDLAGIRGTPLKLLKSFLSNRTQSVMIDGVRSHPASINYGVPQGSVLGPTLFLIYINDLCKMTLKNSKILTFADDTVLLFEGKTWDDVKRTCEENFNKVLQWLDNNILTLNMSKTKYVTFSINQNQQPLNLNIRAHRCDRIKDTYCDCSLLENANSIKYLGITVDQNLNWKQHIKNLSNRIRKLICIFKKVRHLKDISTIKNVYYTLCQSLLAYGIEAWGGATKTTLIQLERAQRAVIKVATFKNYRYSTTSLYREFMVLTVRQLFMHNLVLKQHKIPPPPPLSARRKHTVYRVPSCKTVFAKGFFHYLGPSLYNKFSKSFQTIRDKTYHSCKEILKSHLLTLDYKSTERFLKI